MRPYGDVWKKSWESHFAQKLEEKQQASVKCLGRPAWGVGGGVGMGGCSGEEQLLGIFFLPSRRKTTVPGGWPAFLKRHNI